MLISNIMIDEMNDAIEAAYHWGNDNFISYNKSLELKAELVKLFGEERADELWSEELYDPDDLQLTDEEEQIFNNNSTYDMTDFYKCAEDLCNECYVDSNGDVCQLDYIDDSNLDDEIYNAEFIYKNGYAAWWDFQYKDMYKDYYPDAFKVAIDEMTIYVEDVLQYYEEGDCNYDALVDVLKKLNISPKRTDYNIIAEKLISNYYIVNEDDELVINDNIIDERFLRVYGMNEWLISKFKGVVKCAFFHVIRYKIKSV